MILHLPCSLLLLFCFTTIAPKRCNGNDPVTASISPIQLHRVTTDSDRASSVDVTNSVAENKKSFRTKMFTFINTNIIPYVFLGIDDEYKLNDDLSLFVRRFNSEAGILSRDIEQQCKEVMMQSKVRGIFNEIDASLYKGGEEKDTTKAPFEKKTATAAAGVLESTIGLLANDFSMMYKGAQIMMLSGADAIIDSLFQSDTASLPTTTEHTITTSSKRDMEQHWYSISKHYCRNAFKLKLQIRESFPKIELLLLENNFNFSVGQLFIELLHATVRRTSSVAHFTSDEKNEMKDLSEKIKVLEMMAETVDETFTSVIQQVRDVEEVEMNDKMRVLTFIYMSHLSKIRDMMFLLKEFLPLTTQLKTKEILQQKKLVELQRTDSEIQGVKLQIYKEWFSSLVGSSAAYMNVWSNAAYSVTKELTKLVTYAVFSAFDGILNGIFSSNIGIILMLLILVYFYGFIQTVVRYLYSIPHIIKL